MARFRAPQKLTPDAGCAAAAHSPRRFAPSQFRGEKWPRATTFYVIWPSYFLVRKLDFGPRRARAHAVGRVACAVHHRGLANAGIAGDEQSMLKPRVATTRILVTVRMS